MFELSNDNQRIIDKQVDDMKNKLYNFIYGHNTINNIYYQ